MNREYKIRAVDFDGTLCENKWPEVGEANIALMKYLIDCQAKGDKIILWTCRTGARLIDAVILCRTNGLHFDAINENLPEVLEWMGGDSRKIYADEYIDDKSSTEFKLPFMGKGITTETLVKIQNVFGFELHPWQTDYLLGITEYMPIAGRANGKTFTKCIKILLSDISDFDLHDPETIRYFADGIGQPYMRWFKGYILELDSKLKAAGFETNNKKKGVTSLASTVIITDEQIAAFEKMYDIELCTYQKELLQAVMRNARKDTKNND